MEDHEPEEIIVIDGLRLTYGADLSTVTMVVPVEMIRFISLLFVLQPIEMWDSGADRERFEDAMNAMIAGVL